MDLTRNFGALRAFAATLPDIDVEEHETKKVEGKIHHLFGRHSDKDAA